MNWQRNRLLVRTCSTKESAAAREVERMMMTTMEEGSVVEEKAKEVKMVVVVDEAAAKREEEMTVKTTMMNTEECSNLVCLKITIAKTLTTGTMATGSACRRRFAETFLDLTKGQEEHSGSVRTESSSLP